MTWILDGGTTSSKLEKARINLCRENEPNPTYFRAMSQHRILVPVDFTAVSVTALNHAITIGERYDSEIHLLHIVSKKSDLAEARERLMAFREDHLSSSGIRSTATVRIGDLFEDIDNVSVELEANLIVMGTHGLTGMQFIAGGRALRIVRECSVPFVITQSRNIRESGYDDIVVPLDLHQDTAQKLTIVAEMAKYFNGRVHIISPAETDAGFKETLQENVKYAASYLSERNIEFTTTISEHNSSGFVNDVIRYAASMEADLISIMNLHERSLMGLFGQSYEQQIITNSAEIPVLVVNPIETRVAHIPKPFNF